AKQSKSAKPADYEATVRLDSKQIADMLKSGGAESTNRESATPAPVSTQSAEEFQVAPAPPEAPEAAMAAFGEELASAPEPEKAPATMNSYMEEYLSDAPTVATPTPASHHAEDQNTAGIPVANELPVSRFESEPSNDAPVAALEEFEPTAAAPIAEMPAGQEPGFEATHQSSEPMTAVSKDPELETDPHKATTEFPTKFGTPETDIYEAPMTSVSQELVAASDAMLEATISGHVEGGSQQSARPIDEFEARLQQAMAAYQTEPEPAVETLESQPEPEPTVPGTAEPGNGFDAQVDAAMQAYQTAESELGSETSELHVESFAQENATVETQDAEPTPGEPAEAVAVELNETPVAAIGSSEIVPQEAEPAFAVAHAAIPETDETVIQQMRESFSELPVDGRSMPELGSETDAIPMAMAVAAAASAPSFSAPSSASPAHEAAFEITRALSHAIGAETASEATAESTASQPDGSAPRDANKMASAVERVLQRELPSLVWKVMAEIDIEKQRH